MKILLSESTYQLLTEGRVDVLREKYVKSDRIPNAIFNKFVEADPSTSKEYVQWLCEIYLLGNLKLEDLYKATEYLEIYSKIRHKLSEKEKNLYALSDTKFKIEKFINKKGNEAERKIKFLEIDRLQELQKIIEPYENKPVTNSEVSKEVKKQAKKVYEDDKWVVVIPLSPKASCYYGAGTKWCTASKTYNAFDDYNEDGPLYINIPKNDKSGKKYQFHLASKQFMDERDWEIDLESFFNKNPSLANFYRNEWREEICKQEEIKNKDGVYYMEAVPSYFANLFHTASKNGKARIESILSGDFDYLEFDYYSKYDRFMLDELTDKSKNLITDYLKRNGEWDDEEDLDDNIKMSNDAEIKIANCYSNAMESAANSEYYNGVISNIKKAFGFSELQIGEEYVKGIYAGPPDPLKILYNLDDEKQIKIEIPDISDYPDIDENYYNELIQDEFA